MSYRNGSTPYESTYGVWREMILSANSTIEIGSFYWTLRDSDVRKESDMTKWPGSERVSNTINVVLTLE